MPRWSLSAEFLSLIILTILFLHYYGYEKRVAYTFKRKYFLVCLAGSVCAIVLDILCVYTISYSDIVPLWLNVFLNTLYFFTIVTVCSLLAFYFFILVLEHVYDKNCLKRAFVSISLLTVFFTVAVICNLFTGILFSFDSRGMYHRGPLNRLGYLVMLVELVLLLLCYFRNRRSVSEPMAKVIHVMPPVLVLIALFQIYYPKILLNGILISISTLVLFLSFQSQTLDRDGLTGIRSRNNFFTELTLRTASHQHVQIILVSLQHFAEVNLKYGHNVGDSVLYEIARWLDHQYPDGRAFRCGNVTFALTVPLQSDALANDCLQTVRQRFEEPWVLGDISCLVPFRMTDLRYLGQVQKPIQLIEYLEYALHLADEEGKELVRVDAALCQRYKQREYLISTMKRAIADRRFKVWYQPIYNCRTGTYDCAEALLRLTDYDGHVVPPDVFIPLAEETGMIDDLSWIVLEEICRMQAEKRIPCLSFISINISMQQFLDPALPGNILRYLNQYGLSPDCLKIEITERIFLHDTVHAQRQLAALNDSGIQIYVDDFGTGYANFSGVLNYPFTCIKIDRSLTAGILTDDKSDMTVRTLMTLFHNMGLKVVLEGVETEEQASRLISYGADMIQGFYYARPMPEEELKKFL